MALRCERCRGPRNGDLDSSSPWWHKTACCDTTSDYSYPFTHIANLHHLNANMPLDKYQRLPQDNAANQAMQRAPTPPGLPSEGTGEDPPHSTPLPYAPIAALCLGRIVEGMMFSLIFPYINAMVHDLGVAEEDVGKWSAAAVSHRPFTLSEAVPRSADTNRNAFSLWAVRSLDPSSAISVIVLVVGQCISSHYSAGLWDPSCLG